MKPGVYEGIPNAEYHSGPGISKSGLDLIHRSPLHYHAVVTAENDRVPTPAQELGTAAHALILEPEVFTATYCLALRRSDVPDAIDDREVLVQMVEEINAERVAAHPDAVRDADVLVAKINELNADRLPKLLTGGNKGELVERIMDNQPAETWSAEQLNGMKAPDLKEIINQLNVDRPGLLSTSGSRTDLANLLRANGVDVVLWSEITDAYQHEHGRPYVLSTSTASRHDMAAWLSANGKPVRLWSDVLAEWTENNPGRIVLSPEVWEQIHAMRDAVMAHPAARAVLTIMNDVIGDLKTTEDASPEGFAKSMANYRYDVQAPYYLDGVKKALEQGKCIPPVEGASEMSVYWVDEATGVLCRCRPDWWRGYPKNFVFIAVEKKPPYAVGVYVLDSASTDIGRAIYQHDLQVYAECLASDKWPGYGDLVQTINMPTWHANKNSHLLESSSYDDGIRASFGSNGPRPNW